jgi:hypothetical protein
MEKMRRFLWILSLGTWLAGLVFYALEHAGPDSPRMILSGLLGGR